MIFKLKMVVARIGRCNKWSMKLSKGIKWNATFSQIQKIQEVKLKWFQIRLTHKNQICYKYVTKNHDNHER